MTRGPEFAAEVEQMEPQPHRDRVHRGHHRHHRHRRSVWRRLRKALEMPRVTRRERNQRLAIAVVAVLVGLYLVLRPVFDHMFPAQPAVASAPAPTKAPPKHR